VEALPFEILEGEMKTVRLSHLFVSAMLSLMTAFACSSSSNIVRAQLRGGKDVPAPPGRLFRFASSSDFVAIGTVTNSQAVLNRLTDKEMGENFDLGKVIGGMLYTFQVEDLICAKTDFMPGVMRPFMKGKDFLIFLRRDTPMHENGHGRERLLDKHRYLMFLMALPKQEELPKKYSLEKGQRYYRVFEGQDGLIPLEDDNLPLLLKLRQFCEALSFVDADQKISLLSDLTQSPDPELRQSAKSAIELVRANASRK
jgi:hypothetical protein